MGVRKSLVWVVVFLGSCFLLQDRCVASDTLYVGEKVRLQWGGLWLSGQLLGLDSARAVVRIYGRPRSFALHSGTRMQVARGLKTNANRGAVVGGLAGGLTLGLAALASVMGEEGGWFRPTPAEAFAGGALLGGAAGSVLGAIIGKGIRTERWLDVNPQELIVLPKLYRPGSRAGSVAPKARTSRREAMGRYPWEITASLAAVFGGPSEDVEQAMIHNGWNESEPIYPFTFGPSTVESWKATPYSKKGLAWRVECARRLRNRLGWIVSVSHARIGETYGYARGMGLWLTYRTTVWTCGAFLQLSKAFRLSLAPALLFNQMEREFYRREKQVALGVVGGATLTFPHSRRFFIRLDGRFGYVRRQTFGPFPASGGGLSPFTAHFAHGLLGLGVGVRL